MAIYNIDPTNTLENKGQVLEFYQTFSGASVSFKAFLRGYSESFNSQWSGTPVFGRPDPIQTYQGTTRKISLAFDVLSPDENLAKDWQEECEEYLSKEGKEEEGTVGSPGLAPRERERRLLAQHQLKDQWFFRQI